MAIVLKLKNRPYTQWACSWNPTWRQEREEWASTGSIGEAKTFSSVEEALAWAKVQDIEVEPYTFILEPLRP